MDVSIGFAKTPPPSKLPEHVLWTLSKTGRYAEARVRMTPLGPELRFFIWRTGKSRDEGDLHWSRIYRPQDGGGAALGDDAESKRREFIALGCVPNPDAYAESVTRHDG